MTNMNILLTLEFTQKRPYLTSSSEYFLIKEFSKELPRVLNCLLILSNSNDVRVRIEVSQDVIPLTASLVESIKSYFIFLSWSSLLELSESFLCLSRKLLRIVLLQVISSYFRIVYTALLIERQRQNIITISDTKYKIVAIDLPMTFMLQSGLYLIMKFTCLIMMN